MAKEARNLVGAGQTRLCGSLQQILRGPQLWSAPGMNYPPI
jgi:hypothetical protein